MWHHYLYIVLVTFHIKYLWWVLTDWGPDEIIINSPMWWTVRNLLFSSFIPEPKWNNKPLVFTFLYLTFHMIELSQVVCLMLFLTQPGIKPRPPSDKVLLKLVLVTAKQISSQYTFIMCSICTWKSDVSTVTPQWNPHNEMNEWHEMNEKYFIRREIQRVTESVTRIQRGCYSSTSLILFLLT